MLYLHIRLAGIWLSVIGCISRDLTKSILLELKFFYSASCTKEAKLSFPMPSNTILRSGRMVKRAAEAVVLTAYIKKNFCEIYMPDVTVQLKPQKGKRMIDSRWFLRFWGKMLSVPAPII